MTYELVGELSIWIGIAVACILVHLHNRKIKRNIGKRQYRVQP